jgi:hypothetical protein
MKVFTNVRSAMRLCLVALVATVGAARAQAQDEAKLDLNGKPNFGEVTLKSGFEPDPYTKALTAGGNLKVTVKNVSGNMTKNPDFRLRFEANLGLPLTIYAKSQTDTVLIVNAADGTWLANDDADGLNPVITIPNPKSGRYEIWVGTFINAQATAPATLYISEIYKK